MMEVYEAVTMRRSIREFKSTPVPYEVLRKCVSAARVAPSAANRQLLEFIIVDNENLLSDMFDTVAILGGVVRPKEGWPPGRRPRAYIIVLINTALESELAGNRRDTGFDVGFAVENMILTALEEGLGSCAITACDRAKVGRLFKLTEKYEVAMLVAFGYPDESPVEDIVATSTKRWFDDKGVRHVPKRKLEDILHHNKFP